MTADHELYVASDFEPGADETDKLAMYVSEGLSVCKVCGGAEAELEEACAVVKGANKVEKHGADNVRLWLVPFEELSDLHVLGQHKEWGLMREMLQNPRFQNHNLVWYFKNKRPWLADYHDRIVEEMDVRFDHFRRNGGVHNTPVPDDFIDAGLEHWVPPREWIMFDLISLAHRYQTAPEGKYKWSNRPVPDWAQETLAAEAKLGPWLPTHHLQVHGNLDGLYEADPITDECIELFERKYGQLVDQWLRLDVFNWPYFGTLGVPEWRQHR